MVSMGDGPVSSRGGSSRWGGNVWGDFRGLRQSADELLPRHRTAEDFAPECLLVGHRGLRPLATSSGRDREFVLAVRGLQRLRMDEVEHHLVSVHHFISDL